MESIESSKVVVAEDGNNKVLVLNSNTRLDTEAAPAQSSVEPHMCSTDLPADPLCKRLVRFGVTIHARALQPAADDVCLVAGAQFGRNPC